MRYKFTVVIIRVVNGVESKIGMEVDAPGWAEFNPDQHSWPKIVGAFTQFWEKYRSRFWPGWSLHQMFYVKLYDWAQYPDIDHTYSWGSGR